MSYNNTKLQEKARYNAIKEVKSGRKIAQVARKKFGFHFDTVQTDNGSEFGKKFQDEIIRRGMKWRHTGVRGPNDRTEQYLDFYNNKRLHLGIQFMTPLQKCSQGLELN